MTSCIDKITHVTRHHTLGLLVIFALVACGGGGGGSSVTAVNATPTTNYACDMTVSAAAATHTATYVSQPESLFVFSANTLTFEQWTVQIDDQSYDLNVAIARPPISTSIHGIVLNVHGFSPANATLPPAAMVNSYWDAQMNSRGYMSVSVALRGNFGSTGNRLADIVANGLLGQYQNKQISYADVELASIRYQSASVVAVLQKMSIDPAYQPYLPTIMLIGASGGANTVLQTAADSPVFQAAMKKALVRLTGLDSASDTNPEAGPGVSEYTARIAKNTVSSLWIGGQDDPLTSIGQLACQFKFFDQAAGFPNFFYIVPGLGHGGSTDLFTPTISPVFKQYMVSRGFAGF